MERGRICLFVFYCVFFRFSTAKYFYIYEWPDNLADVYPPPSAELDSQAAYSHDFYDNGGAGKMIDGDYGMFATWQFALFKNLMSRLYASEFRTTDPTKASAFIIPYDAGVHSFIDHNTGKSRLASPFGWKAIDLLTHAKKRNPGIYWKNNGHDHFVIFSVTCYQMIGIGTKQFFMNICQNCTVLTIESTPAGYPIPGRNKKLWYAVPYPSSYHYWEGQTTPPWVVTKTSIESRRMLSIFMGSVKTKTASSNMLRKALYSQCKQAPKEQCQWFETAHADTGILNHSSSLKLYQHTKFCLSPAGDSLTRKSIFDSYLSGCIPVIFALATLRQYGWHLTAEDIASTTVYIPKTDILSGEKNFLDVLSAIGSDELSAMQNRISAIAFRLQYSVVPERYRSPSGAPRPAVADADSQSDGNGGNRNTYGTNDRVNVWKPPKEDAADVIISKILSPETIEPMGGFSDEKLKELQKEQQAIMMTHEDYMGIGLRKKGKTRGKKAPSKRGNGMVAKSRRQ